MKYIRLLLSLTATVLLIVVLNCQLSVGNGKTPRLGYFLSPQKGFWQNAEATDANFDGSIKLKGIKNQADVYFDDRLVPHVYAATTQDAYYVQGYLHAKFRLWQMEFQTHVAAGRLSEIVGEDKIGTDKYFRRLGMNYAAENTLHLMEEDMEMKSYMDAYTAGVNDYISHLKDCDIPFEYKLLDYKPEPWTNLKTALFLKFMSWDLTGQGDDIIYSNAKTFFGYDTYMKLFPNRQDSLDPIIPRGTKFDSASVKVHTPPAYDTNYLFRRDSFTIPRPQQPNRDNGSNNWAVDSSKTKDKKAILCNDPHLGLNLPSLWYEIQITTPTYSVYGASFPGAPAVVIGFNDSIAWGVTNAGRDVKDYYEVQFKDSTMKEYWWNGDWQRTTFRKEIIKVKDKSDSLQIIPMTELGPVMYDKKYMTANKDGKCYAVRWTAHDASNELQTFCKLNGAKNFKDYTEAISTFECPGQNFVFASKAGDVAIRQQGKFVARWKQQGDFVMKGDDSTYMWQGFIPFNENPNMHNPARGFVSSANQKSVDETYPYYLGRASNFPLYRGITINKKLTALNNITVEDMKELQTNNYNALAEQALPYLLKNLNESRMDIAAKKYIDILKDWNRNNAFDEKGATIFSVWWDSLEHQLFDDDYMLSRYPLPWPDASSILQEMMSDSTFDFANDITTSQHETNANAIQAAFDKALKTLQVLDKEGNLAWGKHKDTEVMHLLKLPALSRQHLNVGGGSGIINATKKNHGPSWRMIVHLTDDVEAYGVYPGGQSGNPGSPYFDNFVNTWATGKYYTLHFIKKDDAAKNKNIKWHLSFVKA